MVTLLMRSFCLNYFDSEDRSPKSTINRSNRGLFVMQYKNINHTKKADDIIYEKFILKSKKGV